MSARDVALPLIDNTIQGRRKVGAGGALAPQYLADQLTLSRPGGTHYPHPVLLAPPKFQTLRCAALRVIYSL